MKEKSDPDKLLIADEEPFDKISDEIKKYVIAVGNKDSKIDICL